MGNKSQLPCIKNKCLKYPVCRNKTNVNCTLLVVAMRKIYQVTDQTQKWKFLRKHFPNVITLSSKHTLVDFHPKWRDYVTK